MADIDPDCAEENGHGNKLVAARRKDKIAANLRSVLAILMAAKDILAVVLPGNELIILDMEDAITSVNQELMEALRREGPDG